MNEETTYQVIVLSVDDKNEYIDALLIPVNKIGGTLPLPPGSKCEQVTFASEGRRHIFWKKHTPNLFSSFKEKIINNEYEKIDVVLSNGKGIAEGEGLLIKDGFVKGFIVSIS